MKRNDFDARLAHHLRSIGRETCSEASRPSSTAPQRRSTSRSRATSSASWTNFRNDFEEKRLDADMSRSGR